MSFNIIKQLNADAQEGAASTEAESAAVTNVPVEAAAEAATEAAVETVAEPIAAAAAEPVVAKAPVEERIVTAHDDFDWSVDKRNVSSYNQTEKEKYDKVYDDTFKQINDGEMIQATIEAITKTDAVVNIGFKSDGLISLNEFRDIVGGLKVGDIIEVMVVEKEDREGNLHLSRKQARTSRAWEKIVELHKTGEIVTGIVTAKLKAA